MLTLTKLTQASKAMLNQRIAASIQTSAPSHATLEEKLGLPPRPKKPLTPYFRFMKEIRPDLVKENPEIGALDLVKLMAQKYKTIDPAMMQKFQKEFMKDKEEFLKKKFLYESKLTMEQKEKIIDAKEATAERKERIAYKKRLRENNKPTRPATAFLRFCSEMRDKIPRDTSKPYLDWQKTVAAKWSTLSDQQKEVYLSAARGEFGKYKEELSKWELKMVRLGNTDLVREDSLIERDASKPRRRQNTDNDDTQVKLKSNTEGKKDVNDDVERVDTTKVESASIDQPKEKELEDEKTSIDITTIMWKGLFENIIDFDSWMEFADIIEE